MRSGDWVLGRRAAPFIVEKPAPYRPELWLLLDAGGDQMVAMEVMPPGESPSAVAEWASARLDPGIRLRVDDASLVEALRLQVGEGIEVQEALAPELDEAIESLEAFGELDREPRREHSWADGADADAKAGFYAAAQQFERSRVWETASDGHVLAIDVAAMGWMGGCISVMGMAQETFCLLLLRSMADYVRFVRRADGDPGELQRSPGPGVPLVSVNYDRPRDLPAGKKLAAEARAHGFVLGPGGRVPYLFIVSADGVPAVPTTDDYRLASACLEATRRFVEKHETLFTETPRERYIEEMTVAMPGAAVAVVLTGPPKDLPWRWGEELPIEGLRQRDLDEICLSFHAAREASGASVEKVDEHRWAAQEMLGFKLKRGEALTDWTPDDVRAYLLDYYPSHGSETGDDLQAIPARLDAFLAWLAASGRGQAARLGAARQRVAECRKEFLRQAGDPQRFGVAKTMVQAMRAANVDPPTRQPSTPSSSTSTVACGMTRRSFRRRLGQAGRGRGIRRALPPTLVALVPAVAAAATTSAACRGSGRSVEPLGFLRVAWLRLDIRMIHERWIDKYTERRGSARFPTFP